MKIVCAEMLLKIDKKAFIKENEMIGEKNQRLPLVIFISRLSNNLLQVIFSMKGEKGIWLTLIQG